MKTLLHPVMRKRGKKAQHEKTFLRWEKGESKGKNEIFRGTMPF